MANNGMKFSVKLAHPPKIISTASVVGKMEGEGQLKEYFDIISEDELFGGKSFEEAESRLQIKAATLAIKKANIDKDKLDYILAGDLMGQLMATSFAMEEMSVPIFGLYGACSTLGEAISLGSIIIDGGYGKNVLVLASSHYATAEKQFRFPLGYGNQRPLSATTTVTGCGAFVLGCDKMRGNVIPYEKEQEYKMYITGITTGRIIDYKVNDPNNMGAAMAPAVFDLIRNHMRDFETDFSDYDMIITGDLGVVGREILLDMLCDTGIDIRDKYLDCGMIIYDRNEQDAHSGGSGPGCVAVTFAGFVSAKMKEGFWKKILLIPTGALLSNISFHEGNTIPSIAHGVVIEGKM